MNEGIFIVLAAVVSAMVQAAKTTQGVPVESKNAKFISLVLSTLVVVIYSMYLGIFDLAHVDSMVTSAVAMSVAAVGMYEVVKGFVASLKPLTSKKRKK